jgi:hypothetical protein
MYCISLDLSSLCATPSVICILTLIKLFVYTSATTSILFLLHFFLSLLLICTKEPAFILYKSFTGIEHLHRLTAQVHTCCLVNQSGPIYLSLSLPLLSSVLARPALTSPRARPPPSLCVGVLSVGAPTHHLGPCECTHIRCGAEFNRCSIQHTKRHKICTTIV